MSESDPQSEPSREQFAHRVIEIVRNRFPLMKIARAPQTFSLRVNGRICPLEDLYRQSLIATAEMRPLVERWALDLLRRDEGVPELPESFDDVRADLMPLLRGPQSATADEPERVHRPLVADLTVVYLITTDPTAPVTAPMLQRWGIDADELHQAALANLVARSEAVVAQAAADASGRISLIQFQSRDGYDASRLLLPTLHERLREHLGSPFGAGVPTRDLLLCFRNTEEVRQRMRQPIRDGYRHMPEQLSEQLLLVTADGIAQMIA
jgi:hypothetical protein